MAGIIVGLVLRTPITDTFNSEAKFIASVYADHAWEDGTHAHPAVETVANITGYSERTVQRYVHAVLIPMGMLIPSGKGPKGTNQYSFPLESADGGYVRLKLARGVTVTPRQTDGGDTESGDTESGDRAVSPKQTTHQNLIVVVNVGDIFKLYEQEIGALTPLIADAVEDACNTYPIDWIPEAIQIAVAGNKRSWNYVEGILKNCKSKNVRPSLNRLEKNNGNNDTGNRPGAKQSKSQPADNPGYTDADRAAAQRVRQRQQNLPLVQ